MARVYEEIKKLHSENLFDDLKIVVSLVLSRHANSSFSSECSITSLTPFHIYQLNVYYADAWYESRDYARAERHYKDALGLRRTFRRPSESSERATTNVELASETSVRYKLYKVYIELKQPKAAISVLEALPTKDRSIGINMALGNLYREEGMDRSAITSYKEVLRSCPLSIEAARNLMSLGVQRLNIATLMLNTLQSVNDEEWLVGWINIQQHMVDADWMTALSKIQKFDKVCPRNTDVLNTKADIYFMYGQYAQAKLQWQQLFDGNPLIIRNTDKLAYLLLDSRDQPALSRLCTRLANAGAHHPEPWIVNSAHSILTNDHTDAINLIDKALALEPKSYTAHIVKGISLRLQNKLAVSNKCFREALRYCPTRLEAYKESLKTAVRTLNIKDAVAVANIALKYIGNTPSTLYMYGEALARGNQKQQAKAKMYLEKSIQADPSFVYPVYTLVDIISKQDKHRKAIHILENCLKDNSTSKLHQLLADSLSVVGDRAKAMHHYSIALDLDPGNKRAKEGMEKAEKRSDLNAMDESYVGDSLEHSSEVELNEGVDSLSWSDPELGY